MFGQHAGETPRATLPEAERLAAFAAGGEHGSSNLGMNSPAWGGEEGALGDPVMSPAALESADSPPELADERPLLAALRRGDAVAFEQLVERYHGTMVRLAAVYVANRQVAEEVAQEAWLGVLQGLDRFEGRSSLKTWIFRILTNRAKTRGVRDQRIVTFSALWSVDSEPGEPAVDPSHFLPADHPQWPGHWATPVDEWSRLPEDVLLSQETRARIQAAIDALPPAQRTVVTFRDVEGWSAEEVCAMLEISDANQRVLLHRARTAVRRALERYFATQ
jgi:RNA polymerase sigma-70 factor (ECF subfamily)